MGYILNGTNLKDIFLNGAETKKRYINGTKYYSAGNTVTYYVDSGVYYQEEVDSDASCLSPTTFTPSKSGYNFVGWREDSTASSSILNSKVMGDEPISLYAVFTKKVTATFISYNSTQYANGYVYYNNGNTSNPDVTCPTGATFSGWTWRGWSAANDTTANASVSFANGGTVKNLWSDFTYYGLYQITIRLSYNGNGATGGSVSAQTGTRYYNAAGNYKNPSFTLSNNGFTKTNYSFMKWASGSASGTQYSAGASVTLTTNTTFYAVWQRVSNPVSWYNGSSYGSGYPSNWTITSTDVNCDHEEDCEIYYRTPINDLYANHHEPWSLSAKATGSTGGNQYMEIVVTGISYATLSINGTSITSAGTYTIDVSGLSSVTMNASLGGHEYAVGTIAISSIRFY